MIRTFLLKRGDKTLAEIRTDGNRYEVFDDKTNGLAEKFGAGNFPALQMKVARSSELRLEAPTTGAPGVLRYLLDSGDVVEATTDGKTALLNGRLLEENEKNQLMSNIANGIVVVAHKQDVSRPTPTNQTLKAPQQHSDSVDEDQKDRYRQYANAASEKQAKDSTGTANYDSSIEDMQIPGNTEWPERIKNMMYYLKHGSFKGES